MNETDIAIGNAKLEFQCCPCRDNPQNLFGSVHHLTFGGDHGGLDNAVDRAAHHHLRQFGAALRKTLFKIFGLTLGIAQCFGLIADKRTACLLNFGAEDID